MKDGLTQVKELKDKIHEQYIEIQELNKRVEDLKTINEEHQILNGMLRKEIERLNDELKSDENYYVRNLKTIIKEKDKEIERLNNIINTMLEFNLFAEECPLNFGYTERCNEEKAQDVFYEDDYCEKTCNDDYKKCWLKYFERLQELKGSDKE
jgi:predicted nuclease with TOPRIM domain